MIATSPRQASAAGEAPRPARSRPDHPRLRRLLAFALALVPAALLGCERPEGDALVIATPWTSNERAAIDAAYRKQLPAGPAIVWVALAPGDDPARLVPGLGVDLVLGLPAADLDRLAQADSLIPLDDDDARRWRVARRRSLGLAVNGSFALAAPDPAPLSREFASLVALDDPRRDRVAMAWAQARLASAGFARGYAELVRTSANAARIGRAGSALDRVLQGMAAVAPSAEIEGAIDDRTALVKLEGSPPWTEGVALVRGARREADARAFLRFLGDRGQAGPAPATPVDPIAPVADGLLADLLGATLVDAQDELWAAADVLDRAGHPPVFEGFLGDAPPWPPTSVAGLKKLADPLPLLETLANEITPDREARFWLIESWDRPERPIDDGWLREMAEAAGGRLAGEPRFRAWLRGEWTAWARQHYRRIAREAGKDGS